MQRAKETGSKEESGWRGTERSRIRRMQAWGTTSMLGNPVQFQQTEGSTSDASNIHDERADGRACRKTQCNWNGQIQ
eukprot:2155349-Heterocapsa_arctica.AAC.1